jgi:hypothetical protein
MLPKTDRAMLINGPFCRGRWCVLFGALTVGGDIALGLRRVASCASVHPGMVGDFVAENLLNPSDGSWDGRPIPIRLAVLIAAPAGLTLATGALSRAQSLPVIRLAITSAAVSFVLPFAAAIAYMAFLVGGAEVRVSVAICVAIVGALTWRRRSTRSGRVGVHRRSA